MDNRDIEGSHTKIMKVRKTKYNNIDYSDLTQDDFHTRRRVNPLNPIYCLKDCAGYFLFNIPKKSFYLR